MPSAAISPSTAFATAWRFYRARLRRRSKDLQRRDSLIGNRKRYRESGSNAARRARFAAINMRISPETAEPIPRLAALL